MAMSQRVFLVMCLGAGLLLLSILSSIVTLCLQQRRMSARFGIIDDFPEGNLRKQSLGYNEGNGNFPTMHESINTPLFLEPSKNPQTNTNERQEDIKNHLKVQQDLCPAAIRKNIGLFNTETSTSPIKDNFKGTILLVSSNYAYYNMLQNWEYLANELNLRWAVLALDEKLYNTLGPDRAVPSHESFSVSGAQGWGKGKFQALSCNKIRMVMEVATKCKVNVVYTDVDNIFLKNPFEHDMGRLIASNRYDYLYQPNDRAWGRREDRCLQGNPRSEANTGFYYVRHDSKTYKRVVESTLEHCSDPGNKLDDQSLFWQEFWKYKEHLSGMGDPTVYHHCDLEEYDNPITTRNDSRNEKNNASFQYCCIDPYYYPIGKHGKSGPSNRDPVTFHANYAKNYSVKVEKLENVRIDGYGWNKSRFKDGIGGVLVDEIEEKNYT